jgi:hypothetical protein
LSVGGSSVPAASDEEFSLQPCSLAEESAPKRRKASMAGLASKSRERRRSRRNLDGRWTRS